jgi:hypothetical protein
VVNLICEHCLVSAFVDQQKGVTPGIVDAVARDFDLADNQSLTAPPPPPAQEKFDLMDALKTISSLAEKVRESERDSTKEGKL